MHALLSTAITAAALFMLAESGTARAQDSIPQVSQCMALAQALRWNLLQAWIARCS